MIEKRAFSLPKDLFKVLARSFGIQPGEGTPFLLLLGQSFFLGITMITFYTASNTLFLLEFGATVMPYVYIVTATATTLIGVTFTRLEQRYPLSYVLIATFAFLISSVFILWAGLWLTGAPWLIFVVMAWLRLIWIVSNLVLWVLTGRLFDVRQGKRLFSLIMAGPVFAIIFIGLFTATLINLVGTTNLLLIAGASFVCALVMLLITINKFPRELTKPKNVTPHPKDEKLQQDDRNQTSLKVLFQNKFIRYFFAYTALSTVGTYVLDFAFVTEAGVNYTDSDALGRFFGNYLAISTIILLFISLVAGRFFDRYGIWVGINLNPTMVGLGGLLAVLSGTFLGPVAFLFWLTVFTKLMDDVLVVVNNSGRNLLYQPLQENQRVVVQTAVESIIAPLFVGLVGLTLIFLATLDNFDTTDIFYFFLVIVLGWLGVGVLLQREYSIALRRALTKKSWGDTQALVVDKVGITVLQQGLDSPDVGVVLYSLDMLAENDLEILVEHLPALLNHPVPEVRQAILQRIESLNLTTALSAVKQQILQETTPMVKGAALRTLVALGQEQVFNDVFTYLDDPATQIRVGAMVGLLRSGGLEGILLAGQQLLKMIDSADATERVLAAHILGEVGVQTFYQPLIQFLEDEDVTVQRAALTAITQLQSPQLWPLVVDKLNSPQIAGQAVSALVAGGEAILPVLEKAFNSADQSPIVLSQIALILGRIGSKQAITNLKQKFNVADEQVRLQVLYALSRCGYQATDAEVAQIEAQIKTEIAYAVWLLQIAVAFKREEGINPNNRLLIEVTLRYYLNQARNRVFYLLSFIYDKEAILQARNIFALNVTASKERAYALEMLDTLFSQSLKKIFFPLLNNISLEQQLKQLKSHFPQTTLTSKVYLDALIRQTNGPVNTWLRACVIFAVTQAGDSTLLNGIISALTDSSPLIRETAIWAISQLQPTAQPYLDVLQNKDSNPQVARLIKALNNQQAGEVIMLSTIERVLFLKGVDLFEQVPGEDLTHVAQVARIVTFAPQEIFIQEGDLGNCLYMIIEGEVQILVKGVAKVATLGPKSVIGEMAVLASSLRTASAVALTEITALKIDREDFQELLAEKPELAAGIIKVLVYRLEDASQRLAGLSK